MKKQNIIIGYFLLSLILFLQANLSLLSAQTQGESLYSRLGGVYNIAAVVDDFVDRLLSDPTITANKNVTATMAKITKAGLKYQITELLCQTAGGPQKYNGRSMKESHEGLNITENEWQAMMKDFLATLAKFNIKGAEQNELLVIIGGTKGDIVAPVPQAAQPNAVPTAAPANPPAVIPTPPTPPNNLPQIPGFPTAPSGQAKPSAAPNNQVNPEPIKVPAPSIDSVKPRLEIPENPSMNAAPQPVEEDEAVPEDTQPSAPAPKVDSGLPPEPTLEPAN